MDNMVDFCFHMIWVEYNLHLFHFRSFFAEMKNQLYNMYKTINMYNKFWLCKEGNGVSNPQNLGGNEYDSIPQNFCGRYFINWWPLLHVLAVATSCSGGWNIHPVKIALMRLMDKLLVSTIWSITSDLQISALLM